MKSNTGVSFITGHPNFVGNVPDSSAHKGSKFKTVYCNSKFGCHNNISHAFYGAKSMFSIDSTIN